ncbi:MAG TPA: DUF2007 domain-containing protein [Vicinamibacterales bacterium]|jgi:hypothetical protein
MDEDALTIVRTFGYRQEAELARGALRAAGIEAVVTSDDAGGLRPAMGWANGVRLLVRAADVAAATELLDANAERVDPR